MTDNPTVPGPRPCTCHPDDSPPVPCPQKFALSECKAAAPVAAPAPCPVCHGEGIVLIGDGYSVDGCPACRPAAPAPDAATVELPPLPDIEQEVYARTHTFLRNDEIVAVGQLMEVYASEAIRAAHPAPVTAPAADIPVCHCAEYYGEHHPECPVRAAVEQVIAENLQRGNVIGRITAHLLGNKNNVTDEDVVIAAAEVGRELQGAMERAERAEQDAARYRWLRDGYSKNPPGVFHPVFVMRGGNNWHPTLDAAIDAALKEGK